MLALKMKRHFLLYKIKRQKMTEKSDEEVLELIEKLKHISKDVSSFSCSGFLRFQKLPFFMCKIMSLLNKNIEI